MSELHKPGFAPQEVFDQTKFWFPIPTYDLILESDKGIILVKRKIAPYQNVWALPGLRAMKGVSQEERLRQIAKTEVGVQIDPTRRFWLAEYQRQFEDDPNFREDLSQCYVLPVEAHQDITINQEHFSEFTFWNADEKMPQPIGDMYEYYLNQYVKRLEKLDKFLP